MVQSQIISYEWLTPVFVYSLQDLHGLSTERPKTIVKLRYDMRPAYFVSRGISQTGKQGGQLARGRSGRILLENYSVEIWSGCYLIRRSIEVFQIDGSKQPTLVWLLINLFAMVSTCQIISYHSRSAHARKWLLPDEIWRAPQYQPILIVSVHALCKYLAMRTWTQKSCGGRFFFELFRRRWSRRHRPHQSRSHQNQGEEEKGLRSDLLSENERRNNRMNDLCGCNHQGTRESPWKII